MRNAHWHYTAQGIMRMRSPVSTHIRAPRIPAAVTIGGRHLFHSELLIVWPLLEGGDYSKAVSNRRSTVHAYGPFVDST